MTEDDQAKKDWKAPYFTYATLNTFIDKKCAGGPIPPQIDKTFIDNVAGGVQPLLLGALRLVGFITAGGLTKPLLHEAAESPEKRKAIMTAWATEFYADQIELAKSNATPQMLADSFAKSGYQGSTLRKAIVFYLSLTDDLELPKSPHFKAPKQPSTGATRRGRGKITYPMTPETPVVPTAPSVSGERVDITLPGAGTVTIFVDVKWFALPDESFTALRNAIREIEALGADDAADNDQVADEPEEEDV